MRFLVIIHSGIPSVILETGFIGRTTGDCCALTLTPGVWIACPVASS